VIPMTLAEIASAVTGTLSDVPDPQACVTGPAASDSREVVPGGMLTAVTGSHVDGHDFAADVTAAGVASCWPPGRSGFLLSSSVMSPPR